MVGLDYHGVRVLAAYEPVAVLNLGVVAKMDLADIRAPFLRAAALVIGLALLLISAATVLFFHLSNPMVRSIRESERRYERIFNGAGVAIWEQDLYEVWQELQHLRRQGVTDLQAYLLANPATTQRLSGLVRIRHVNAATVDMVGARSREQLLEWFEQRFIPASEQMFIAQFCSIWEGRTLFRTQITLPKTLYGGERRAILSMLIPDTPGGFRCVPVSALDITADALLRRREGELELILASTGEGIFGMDSDGRCTFANRSAVQLLGYQDQQDLLGREMHALLQPSRPDGTPRRPEDCPIYRACCGDTRVVLEDVVLWRADQTCFPAEYRSYPMVRDGEVLGTVCTFVDITERKEREAQLVHAQKLEVLGKLTGSIAHDFNNLLTVILGNLQYLAGKTRADVSSETRECVDDALSAARDGAELTQRLLAFSRKQTLRPQRIDVNEFLVDTQGFLGRVIGEHIALRVAPGEAGLVILVDPHQLRSALLNLTINARDAMPEGGELRVETRRRRIAAEQAVQDKELASGSYIVVSVTDSGAGMSAETLSRAVEPFYTTKAPGKGSGLGLSMVYGFARQSGGSLMIESAPGQGTSVSLWLPEAGPAADDEEREPVSSRGPVEGERVLVVEDDARVRHFATRTLSGLGYRVLEVADGDAAVRVLEARDDIDLLFTDIVMPGEIGGRALARWALDRRPGLRVLLTTGFADQLDQADRDGGAVSVLAKPYSRQQLEEAIRTVLDGRAPLTSSPR